MIKISILKHIKKGVWTGLALSAISLTANAQGSPDLRDRFYGGIKAGINRANVYDARGEDFYTNGKTGFAGGLFFSIPIVNILGIQPEILFSQKGFKSTGRLLGSTYELKRTSNFIDVPLYLAFKPAKFLSILAGPQFSYLLSQKNSFENGTTGISQENAFDNEGPRKSMIGFSAGVDLNIHHVVLSARAGWDMMANNKNKDYVTPRYKNAWYQFTVGYRFYK